MRGASGTLCILTPSRKLDHLLVLILSCLQSQRGPFPRLPSPPLSSALHSSSSSGTHTETKRQSGVAWRGVARQESSAARRTMAWDGGRDCSKYPPQPEAVRAAQTGSPLFINKTQSKFSEVARRITASISTSSSSLRTSGYVVFSGRTSPASNDTRKIVEAVDLKGPFHCQK